MFTKQTKFILAIALQVMIIFALIIFKLSVLTGGTEVMLRILPVDPRDMLRGDYVTFQYDISNPNSYDARGEQLENGDTVYVTLRQGGEYYYMEGIQKNQPTDDDIFIKGKVESGGGSRTHVVYGIEQYFIPEGEGRTFNFTNKEAAARVAVDSNGNAALKQIYIDGKPWPPSR